MSLLLVLISLVPLTIIIYQDFKFRAIHWFLLVILSITLGSSAVIEHGWEIAWHHTYLNLVFLLLQLLVLFIYFSFKRMAPVNILDKHIGLGDVLFFVVLCCSFSFINFILFLTVSLCCTTIYYAAKILRKKEVGKEIPLAAWVSMSFIIVLLLDEAKLINRFDDNAILQLIGI